MRLKKNARMVLNLILVYVVAGIIIFAMSERIQRLNEIEQLEKNGYVVIKNNK